MLKLKPDGANGFARAAEMGTAKNTRRQTEKRCQRESFLPFQKVERERKHATERGIRALLKYFSLFCRTTNGRQNLGAGIGISRSTAATSRGNYFKGSSNFKRDAKMTLLH